MKNFFLLLLLLLLAAAAEGTPTVRRRDRIDEGPASGGSSKEIDYDSSPLYRVISRFSGAIGRASDLAYRGFNAVSSYVSSTSESIQHISGLTFTLYEKQDAIELQNESNTFIIHLMLAMRTEDNSYIAPCISAYVRSGGSLYFTPPSSSSSGGSSDIARLRVFNECATSQFMHSVAATTTISHLFLKNGIPSSSGGGGSSSSSDRGRLEL